MKISRDNKIYLALSLFVVGAWFVFFRLPSEGEMISNYQAHQSEFEQLRSMFQQDQQINRLSFRVLESQDDQEVPKPRRDIYRRLMKRVGVDTLIRHSNQPNYIRFIVSGGGLADTTWSIGYAWSREAPKNLVDSAYHSMPETANPWVAHSRVEGDWYIYHRR